MKTKIQLEYLSKLAYRNDISPDEIKEEYFKIFDLIDGDFRIDEKLKENIVIVNKDDEELNNSDIARAIIGFGIFNKAVKDSRNRKFYRNRKKYPKASVILAEGDSWFCYPIPQIKDVIGHLIEDYNIYTMAYGGDWAAEMSHDKVWDKTRAKIEKLNVECLLLSMGGNDILGRIEVSDDLQGRKKIPRLETFLNEYSDANNTIDTLINKEEFGKAVITIREQYRKIFEDMNNLYPTIPILINTYDYPFPKVSTTYKDSGKWLGRAMFTKGIFDPIIQREIAIYLIDTFINEIADLSANYDQIHLIDSKVTTMDNQWENEIHIETPYMNLVGKKFSEKMLELGLINQDM